ncbi:high-affinity choline transporter 1-like [Pomacea canaliculata]|uniref:high-affinity choline transporter 1-like n=1 Tax=Pomacea canaliculata TaxID=400727 RepID=UPI000D726176|nr:high-affinity choline transporter 1-like [Pomacea canaliculata]XP_025099159.1 high-affinity choline transporter 1-like [Pomacea canaliculata]
MSVNIPGLCAVVVLYIVILVIGLIAGRKTAKSKSRDDIILANRSMGFFLSSFTVTATLIGGGYINGTAEAVAFQGLLWANAPVCYCISLIIGGLVYAPKMRRGEYVTMFDPFQLKYGRKVGAFLFLPQVLGDLFWAAAILSALGNTISVILDFDTTISIIISACVAVVYTFLGGLYSVAYTDVIQLVFIAVGLFLVFPFAMNHEAVDISRVSGTWIGTIPTSSIGVYLDFTLLLILGGIPWQTYFQRVLACRNARVACVSSLVGAVASVILAIPPCVIGVVGGSTDWNLTSYPGEIPIPPSKQSSILPLVLQYLCPVPVSVIGIGAVSAAVMSSADSIILASASVFTKNVYCEIIRPKASDLEMVWALRVSIVVVGVLGTVVAVTANTIYGLYVLCSDLMYVILFPQLTLVLWFPPANAYGCLAGYLLALTLRLLGGEGLLALPAALHYPWYDASEDVQRFPFRTFSMLCCVLAIVVVSLLTNAMFLRGWVPLKYDVLRCSRRRTIQMRPSKADGQTSDKELRSLPIVDGEVKVTDSVSVVPAEVIGASNQTTKLYGSSRHG